MKLRLKHALVLAFAVALTGCGVKGDLEKPNGQPTHKGEKDASRPPSPIGR